MKLNNLNLYCYSKPILSNAQNEIGSFDQNLKLKDLRILSDTETAELGSAIAFEIDKSI